MNVVKGPWPSVSSRVRQTAAHGPFVQYLDQVRHGPFNGEQRLVHLAADHEAVKEVKLALCRTTDRINTPSLAWTNAQGRARLAGSLPVGFLDRRTPSMRMTASDRQSR